MSTAWKRAMIQALHEQGMTYLQITLEAGCTSKEVHRALHPEVYGDPPYIPKDVQASANDHAKAMMKNRNCEYCDGKSGQHYQNCVTLWVGRKDLGTVEENLASVP